MIIKEVIIENYMCYYGIKRFHLSNGLNLFLGENGEGKTKFFEALEWLFGKETNKLEQLVSKKALHEKSLGDSFRVRVEIITEQYGESKILSKQFSVTKEKDNNCIPGRVSLKGIEEAKNGERTPIDGNTLLDHLFPTQIRRYSMFKGEDELNIFDNEDALINLINLFSDAKHYEKYETVGEYLKEEGQKAVDRESRSNSKNQAEYKRIEGNIKEFTRQKNDLLTFLEETEKSFDKTKKNIQEAEKYINNAEALDVINKRIRYVESEITETSALISENYTTRLFDENWILMNFESIHQEFSEKISNLSREKRKLQSEFDRELGIKEGEKRAKLDIINDLTPLPFNVPSLAIMDEMVKEKVCKVCNRPAEEGSDALEFMRNRLNAYLQSQEETTEDKPEVLFENNYTSKLENLSANQDDNLSDLRKIKSEIKDLFEFNQARREKVLELEEKLENELKEREKIIGNSSIGSEKLGVVLKDYNVWQDDIKKLNEDSVSYNHKIKKIDSELEELQKKKDQIDLTNANAFLIKTRDVLRDIHHIFKETKNRKFEEFIDLLSEKSNEIFSKINVDAFTGVITFNLIQLDRKVNVRIQLTEENGNVFYSPNQSLLTSMHISILLAISELTQVVREESYPMIFDAPTSSFGESKMTEFLNLISETNNQTIILIKDYIAKDDNNNLYIKPEFDSVKRDKAFWIKLERPFDEKNLKTINSQRIEI